MGKTKEEEQDLVQFIIMVQKLDREGLLLLRSNAEMLAEKKKRKNQSSFSLC